MCASGVQNESPQGVPLWQADYFELKATETLWAQEELLPPSPYYPEALPMIRVITRNNSLWTIGSYLVIQSHGVLIIRPTERIWKGRATFLSPPHPTTCWGGTDSTMSEGRPRCSIFDSVKCLAPMNCPRGGESKQADQNPVLRTALLSLSFPFSCLLPSCPAFSAGLQSGSQWLFKFNRPLLFLLVIVQPRMFSLTSPQAQAIPKRTAIGPWLPMGVVRAFLGLGTKIPGQGLTIHWHQISSRQHHHQKPIHGAFYGFQSILRAVSHSYQ